MAFQAPRRDLIMVSNDTCLHGPWSFSGMMGKIGWWSAPGVLSGRCGWESPAAPDVALRLDRPPACRASSPSSRPPTSRPRPWSTGSSRRSAWTTTRASTWCSSSTRSTSPSSAPPRSSPSARRPRSSGTSSARSVLGQWHTERAKPCGKASLYSGFLSRLLAKLLKSVRKVRTSYHHCALLISG